MSTDDTVADEPQTAVADADQNQETSEQDEAMAKLKEAIIVEREEIGSLRLKMKVSVPREIIDERLSKQLDDLKRDAVIPGFRKGHAPFRLVEKRFASDVGDELTGQLLGSGYLAAVEKEDLTPLGDPLIWVTVTEERTSEDGATRKVDTDKLLPVDRAVEHMTLPKEGALSFTCELELKPKFELPALDEIPVERPKLTVENEAVDEELRRMRMFRGTFRPIEEGTTERDDMLYVDLRMLVGGDALLDEHNTELPVRDVRLMGIPLSGLGEALEGKERDDTVTFEAAVPDDHENADIRGKTARLDIHIREIKRLVVPPIDDDFIASMGCDSESELRDSMRGMLESRLEQDAREHMREQIGAYLIDKTALDIPPGLSQRQTERSVSRRMVQMYQSGVPESEISKTADKMRSQAHDEVVRDLKLFFILEKIAEERKVDVSEEQLNGAISAIAQRTGKRFDRVRDEMSKGDSLMTLYVHLRDRAVLDQLLAKAAVTEASDRKTKPPRTRAAVSKKRSEAKTAPKTPATATSSRKKTSASKSAAKASRARKPTATKASPKKVTKKKKST